MKEIQLKNKYHHFLLKVHKIRQISFILLALISFFFEIEQSYPRIYWTDFHDFFSPNGRNLCECCQSGPVFPIPQETLPWQTILWQNTY